MAEKGLPASRLPTSCKTMKTKATDQAKAKDPPQIDHQQQNPSLEPEVAIVPPNQVPDPDPPTSDPPAHIPDPPPPPLIPPVHIPNPPVHVPNPVQLQNPPVHVPNTVQPPNPPVPVPNPMQSQGPPLHVPIPVQSQILPAQVPNPILPQAPPVQMPQLNWSYFKPEFEFSGKPEEDAEAHLLRTNDWMETHNFPDVAKVQCFCLTLTSEARL